MSTCVDEVHFDKEKNCLSFVIFKIHIANKIAVENMAFFLK